MSYIGLAKAEDGGETDQECPHGVAGFRGGAHPAPLKNPKQDEFDTNNAG
jgi:hypothetical protein